MCSRLDGKGKNKYFFPNLINYSYLCMYTNEGKKMYISDELRTELQYFRRTNGHYVLEAGKATNNVINASYEMLYMAMSASLVMDYSEDGFFENFVITDKSISGKDDLQIDAYALIETDSTSVKQLHIFQYKLNENKTNSASPVELQNFATFINNNFVHPELLDAPSTNGVVKEIKEKFDDFISKRGRRIKVYCHYINNTQGIAKSNEKPINAVMGRFEQDKQQLGFSVQVYGLKEIMELAKEGKIQISSENVEMVVDGQNSYRLEDNTTRTSMGLPKKVIIGMCNVNEFIRLQNKYHHNQLYAENIRLYLGDRASVNKDIINTITGTESLWFPYMNNGISIICDELTVGNTSSEKKVMGLTLKNMQIINGCQTVNALYSAKYGELTRDNFRPSNVMVRIYEIAPEQTDFKMNVIKATNNQNAVKTYSLMANDPIQIQITRTLKLFDIVYDRKGESRQLTDVNMVSMLNVALSYRAVFLFMAQSLRSRLGQSRVFQKGEYEKVFNSELLETDRKEEFNTLCCKLIMASEILDSIRDLIQENAETYLPQLPIFKKSAYYLCGYVYALKNKEFNRILTQMVAALSRGNELEIKGKNFPAMISNLTKDSSEELMTDYINFYQAQNLNKADVDNLLKSKDFGDAYRKRIEGIIGKIEDIEEE